MRTAKEMEAMSIFAAVPRDKVMAQKFLAAAERKAADAKIEALSYDSRVEATYDALYHLASSVLACLGYRSSCTDSHHLMVLEAVCAEIQAPRELFTRVDALRKIRNMKYNGATRCLNDYKVAAAILKDFSSLVERWLAHNLPLLFR